MKDGFQKTHHEKTKVSSLILVHGLSNVHQWGDEFISVCLEKFGSGNVFLVSMNKSTDVRTREIEGRTVTICGNNTHLFGATDYISKQVNFLEEKVSVLAARGLSDKFSIIAHSMGGLVSRNFIYRNPATVSNLVTIATPHNGSPLAHSLKLPGYLIMANKAISNLSPEFINEFNRKYPVSGSPLAEGGAIWTIDGRSSGCSLGWCGEVAICRFVMKRIHHVESDGFVPWGNARIDGAPHIASFENLDHYQLVHKREVAVAACSRL